MKAVLFRSHGGPEVLEYADVPAPTPGPGEVLVRVKACSMNHLDLWIREGIPVYRMTLPHISGCDVAGVVEQVGPDVEGIRRGAAVVIAPGLSCFACRWCQAGLDNLCDSYGIVGAKSDGGYAELMKAPARNVIPIPQALSWEEAAAFPLVFLTAWHMLMTRASVRPGETVLIHAAGSGIGHAAVQIALRRFPLLLQALRRLALLGEPGRYRSSGVLAFGGPTVFFKGSSSVLFPSVFFRLCEHRQPKTNRHHETHYRAFHSSPPCAFPLSRPRLAPGACYLM